MVEDLRGRLGDRMLQGEFLHVLVSFFRRQELDGKIPFYRASLMVARHLGGIKALDLFSRVETELIRMTPLGVYHWMGSAYQERLRKENKIKFSMVLGGLAFPVGYRAGVFLKFEQGVFNPLKPAVLKNLLARDESRDFPHIDLFGRVGIWRLSDDVWSSSFSVLDHFCRRMSESIARAELSAIDLNSYERVGGLEQHVKEMLDFEVEERIRLRIRDAGETDDEKVDMMSFIVCLQVCVHLTLQHGTH